MRNRNWAVGVTAGALGLAGVLLGCGSSDSESKTEPPKTLGAPCVSGSEDDASYSGHSLDEVEIGVSARDCGGGGAVCLVNHFQGRVSCPYGQGIDGKSAPTDECYLPRSEEKVTAPVKPQLIHRRPDKAVYCSCRCAGNDTEAQYCECSAGFECLELVPDLGLGASHSGSYCVKKGSEVDDVATVPSDSCTRDSEQAKTFCGEARPLPP